MYAAVAFEARAKLNLGLAVGPLRPDGFHDLATFFQSISLADTLIARRARAEFSLRIGARSDATGRARFRRQEQPRPPRRA